MKKNFNFPCIEPEVPEPDIIIERSVADRAPEDPGFFRPPNPDHQWEKNRPKSYLNFLRDIFFVIKDSKRVVCQYSVLNLLDPDPEFWKPYPVKNCLDPQHWLKIIFLSLFYFWANYIRALNKSAFCKNRYSCDFGWFFVCQFFHDFCWFFY